MEQIQEQSRELEAKLLDTLFDDEDEAPKKTVIKIK